MNIELNRIKRQIQEIEETIKDLYKCDPIFGLITKKHIKCGKKNCKCSTDSKYMHGPYYYLRIEPEYKYKKYLGKNVPKDILKRISAGNEIRKLENMKKRLKRVLKELERISKIN